MKYALAIAALLIGGTANATCSSNFASCDNVNAQNVAYGKYSDAYAAARLAAPTFRWEQSAAQRATCRTFVENNPGFDPSLLFERCTAQQRDTAFSVYVTRFHAPKPVAPTVIARVPQEFKDAEAYCKGVTSMQWRACFDQARGTQRAQQPVRYYTDIFGVRRVDDSQTQ